MLKLNEDYYLDKNGNVVFTEAYHLKHGHCCGSGCLHCPFKIIDPNVPQELTSSWTEEEFDDSEDFE